MNIVNILQRDKNVTVIVYRGYGHTHNMTVFGHVFKNKMAIRRHYSNNMLVNTIYLLKLFFVKPLAGVSVQLEWRGRIFTIVTEHDGFFTFKWQSETEVEAGWHPVTVTCMGNDKKIVGTGYGEVHVPDSTQYGFISDIDDTVLISHSGNTLKKLTLLFTRNPRTRKIFSEVVENYRLFSLAHTTPAFPNPFFYISNSEWNLYSDLIEFFNHNALPKGSFILNHLKRWFQLFKTGESERDTKYRRAVRVMETFPKQLFILLGDNSQKDPEIYASLVKKYPERIFAVYIRNINGKKEMQTQRIFSSIEALGVFTCFFTVSEEAIEHARKIKLIQ